MRYTNETPMTADWLLSYAAKLERFKMLIEKHAAIMKELQITEVSATHYETSQQALKKFESFYGAISKALAEYDSPETPSTKQKPATKKDPKKS